MTATPQKIFATMATADRIDAGVGVIWWSLTPRAPYLLQVPDYDLIAASAVNDTFLEALFHRAAELVAQHRPIEPRCIVYCESPGLLDLLRVAARAWIGRHPGQALSPAVLDIELPSARDVARWPPTLDARVAAIRPLINAGNTIRLETGLRQFTFRASKTNHLVAAIKHHRPGEPATATELMHAFVLGVLLERESDQRMQLPAPTPIVPEGEGLLARIAGTLRHAIAPQAAPAARKPSPPGLWLAPGDWMIDERPVTVVADPARADGTGFVALAPGGHIVRRRNSAVGTIMRVDNPAAAIRVI